MQGKGVCMKNLFGSPKKPSVHTLHREVQFYWEKRIGYYTFDKKTFGQCLSFRNLYRVFSLAHHSPQIKDPVLFYATDGTLYPGRVWYVNSQTGIGVFRLENVKYAQSAQDVHGEPTIPTHAAMKKGFYNYDAWLVSLQENEKCNFEKLLSRSCTVFDKYGRMVLTDTHSYRDGSIVFGFSPSDEKLDYLLGMITKIPDERGVHIRCVARPDFLKQAVEDASKAFDPTRSSTPLIPAELF